MLQAKKTLKEEKDVKLHPSVRSALQGASLLSFPYTCSSRFSQTPIHNDCHLSVLRDAFTLPVLTHLLWYSAMLLSSSRICLPAKSMVIFLASREA